VLIMLPLVLIFEQPWQLTPPGLETWLSLMALAIFCTALAYVLYFRLIDSAGATNAILVTFLIPVTAILLGSGLLGEVLALRHFLGMAMIVAGLALIDGRVFARREPASA
jgi:drug/metabolite transporter (DMT)-like permease